MMYLRIRACAFPTQKFTTVIIITSNKHQLINTSAAEQSCMAEVLCSCFGVKQGLSLQLHVPLSSPAASLLASPDHTLLCSVWALLCSTGTPRSFEGDWARIKCQEYFFALEIFLLPLLPILKSWHCLSSLTYLLPEPVSRTQMLQVGLRAGMRWLTGRWSCSSLLLLQTLRWLLLPGGHLRFLVLWWELPLLLVFLIRGLAF